MIIQLVDGFNGSTMRFDSFPLQIDGDCVKLQCAESGKSYMHKWVHATDYNQAILESLKLE